MEMNDMIICSVDDHIIEPPDMWEKVLPASMKDKAPKIVSINGADSWVYEGRTMPNVALNAVVGRTQEEYGFEPIGYSQIRKGTWDVHERVKDLNADGVLAELMFPTMALFAGTAFLQSKDKTTAYALVQAYNDWSMDVWADAEPGRFIKQAILPLWDIDLCVAEAKRAAKKGCHSITFPDIPAKAGLPTIHSGYWDPLFKVMVENKMIVSAHIGSANAAPFASDESPIDAWITTMPMSIHVAASDWLWSDVFLKFPELKISLAEGGIGWVPYMLERAEFVYRHHKAWTHSNMKGMTPSELFHRNFMVCFIEDKFGLQSTSYLNMDHVMWECDYPHSDCVWPNSAEVVWDGVKHLTKSVIDKVTHQNVMREFSFDPFAVLGRENCTVGALRAKAKAQGVDTSKKAGLGGLDPRKGSTKRVTSKDIFEIFAKAEAFGMKAAQEEASA
jgi:predicted TIM-barrel fold metal-dependent hydrolase